jgi:NAD(P)-dependent dehydrogenase (short-subunit alcohol dehydrogenase family)
MDWTGKIAFISGGTSGIGLASAVRLAGLGADLFLFSLDATSQRATAVAEVEAARVSASQRFRVARLDVSDSAAVTSVLSEAVTSVGPPDLLINCAGIGGPDYFENIGADSFDAMMKVNVSGVRNTIAALLPALKKTRGTIVNMASLGGLIGSFGNTAYGAGKFAVVGLSEALRAEFLRFGIRVMVICPPPVDTPMWHRSNERRPPENGVVNAGSGLLRPGEVVDAMLSGLRRGKFLVVPGRKARFAYHLNRLLPGVRTYLTDRMVRKAQGSASARLPDSRND